MPDRFHIKIKGETKTYSIAGGRWRTIDQAAELIGDLWGYKPEYIKKEHLAKVKRGESVTLRKGELSIVPMRFIIRREA